MLSPRGEPLYDVPAFQLTDQNGKTVTNRDLIGKVWVADFIFTQLRRSVSAHDLAAGRPFKNVSIGPKCRFVSFSVDPEHDTPAVLKEYARQYNADESRWSFLTGTGRRLTTSPRR